MKGAYSSPDEMGSMELSRAMYPDTYLGKDSGGDPKAIPSLTYEKFISTYKKHYHPSLSRIILDGQMDVPLALSIINEHLSKFDHSSECPLFPKSKPQISPSKKVPFEIPDGEDEAAHARFLFGYSASDYSDKATLLGATILCDLLTSTNASPLKKAFLDKKLAGDAAMYLSKSVENTLVLEVRDTDEEKYAEVEKAIRDVVTRLVQNGIDKKRLASLLDNLDFKQREQDFGTLPVGVAYALAAFGYWMYGSLPEEALLTEETLAFLREQIKGDYFEKLLASLMIDNQHRASIIMIPDKSEARKAAEAEAERIAKIRVALTAEDLKKIEEENRALKAWQSADESALQSCLPKLSLSDITDNSEKNEAEEIEMKGTKILRQSIKTNGIVYISMHFSADDLDKEDILPLSILSSTLTNLPTKKRDALTLQSDIKSNFGVFYSSGAVLQKRECAHTYLKFFLSALDSKKEDVLDLITDVITSTVFDDTEEIMNTILQARSQLEDAIVSSGESLAISRAESGISASCTISEYLSGYEAYKVLRDACSDKKKAEELIFGIKNLYKKLITRERLTISFAGNYDEDFVERIIDALPSEKSEIFPTTIKSQASEKEFFVVPSRVAYAALSGKSKRSCENLGFLRVARSILSYEYLWNTIRVKNGAYGAGFIPRRDGLITFYSYRDPSPAASVKIFAESADYLRELAKTDCDLTKFIIGAIGEYDILTTPKTRAILSTRDYLCGIPADFEEKVRREMLRMTKEDLLVCADIIDEIISSARIATVGGKEHLDQFDKETLTVIEL